MHAPVLIVKTSMLASSLYTKDIRVNTTDTIDDEALD